MSFFSRKKHAHPPQGSVQVSQPAPAPQPQSTVQPLKQLVKEPSYERCVPAPSLDSGLGNRAARRARVAAHTLDPLTLAFQRAKRTWQPLARASDNPAELDAAPAAAPRRQP